MQARYDEWMIGKKKKYGSTGWCSGVTDDVLELTQEMYRKVPDSSSVAMEDSYRKHRDQAYTSYRWPNF